MIGKRVTVTLPEHLPELIEDLEMSKGSLARRIITLAWLGALTCKKGAQLETDNSYGVAANNVAEADEETRSIVKSIMGRKD